MSSIWFQRTSDGPYEAVALEGGTDLAAVAGAAVRGLRLATSSAGRFALLAPGANKVQVNGQPVIGGIRVLGHRDELTLGDGHIVYFSDETLAVVGRFASTDGQAPPRCPVCRRDVVHGQWIVTCPRCGRVYHQAVDNTDPAAKACWTYREVCLCGHPTGLTEDAVWRPDKELSHA
ncbi:MAG: hypothetical protein K1X74_17345 [Pirellulales bacterium]|nr:hypothetical protein [Pirellulales bacterium]